MEEKSTKEKKKESFLRRPLGILRKQLGYKRELIHPNLIRVVIPTLPYEGLDYTGKKMLPWSLMKLFDSCEISEFWPLIKDKFDTGEVRVFYTLNFEMKVDYKFHLLETSKFPLILDTSVQFVKRTSRCIESTLRHPSLQTPYAVASHVDVNMDPISRVPIPFPAWWKEHFKFPDKGVRREFKLPPKSSVGVFTSQHRVEFSDTDENKHTNYTVYVRLAFNSMCENILSKRYGQSLDVYEIGLNTLQITYHNECGLGDTLTVSSWESKEAILTFYFEIHKSDVLCATLSMSFYNMLDGNIYSNL
ncbi:hypothetical protein ACF0H5_012307 [Mactra antiquata]